MKILEKIQDTIAEVNRRASVKIDTIVPANSLTVAPHDDGVTLNYGEEQVEILERAHNQLASITKIPANYYQRLQDDDNFMLAGNVNHWLRQSDRSHMVRVLDGQARALMSDMYLRIDNEVIARHALPEVLKQGDSVYPLQSMVTDDRMSLKFLHQDLKAEIDDKGTIRPGIVISNSETGQGRFNVQSFFFRDFCENGCIFGRADIDLAISQVHRGARLPVGMLSQETLGYMSQTIASQTADMIRYIFSSEGFGHMVSRLKAIADSARVAPVHAIDMVKVLGQDFQLSQQERQGALDSLLSDGDFTQWGVVNAITKQANTADNDDRINHLENAGAKLIDFNQVQWDRIVNRVNAMPVQIAA